MKNFLLLLSIVLAAVAGKTQPLNWANNQENSRHLISVQAGILYGLTFSVGYSYQLPSRLPIRLNAEYSFPSGKIWTDDFKTRIGGEIGLIRSNHFQVNTRLYGVFRRYQNDFARILNFGSDIGLSAGYYRNKWFVAPEIGFDKAIVSNFKHSPAYRDVYPSAQDGWYQPSTGGNFYYGLQAGFSVNKSDITLAGGKIITQDFKTEPNLPLYLQLGLNRRF